MRRRAVKEHLPRLAYIVSDIVIFVDILTLGSTKYIKRLKKMAGSVATRGVTSSEKPICIILQNRSDFIPGETIDQTSANFLEAHPTLNSLKEFYSEIKCIKIPNFNETGGKANFDSQIQVLKVKKIFLFLFFSSNKSQIIFRI